ATAITAVLMAASSGQQTAFAAADQWPGGRAGVTRVEISTSGRGGGADGARGCGRPRSLRKRTKRQELALGDRDRRPQQARRAPRAAAGSTAAAIVPPMWLLFHRNAKTRVVRDGQSFIETCPECGRRARFDEVEVSESYGVFFVDLVGDKQRKYRCGACGDV